jgi:hypothetical protein
MIAVSMRRFAGDREAALSLPQEEGLGVVTPRQANRRKENAPRTVRKTASGAAVRQSEPWQQAAAPPKALNNPGSQSGDSSSYPMVKPAGSEALLPPPAPSRSVRAAVGDPNSGPAVKTLQTHLAGFMVLSAVGHALRMIA